MPKRQEKGNLRNNSEFVHNQHETYTTDDIISE